MERQQQIDVLVVDNHHIVAQGLALVVNSEPTMRVVGTAGNIKDAVDVCAALTPDVVLMDLGLPDGDAAAKRCQQRSGIETARGLGEGVGTRSIVLRHPTLRQSHLAAY